MSCRKGAMSQANENDKSIAILFSGGRDSSLAACLYSLQGYRVHLLSFISGLGVKGDISNYRYDELKARFPDNIVCRQHLPTFGLVRKISLVDIEKDFATYKKNLILVGEKMAMHAAAIVYCLQHEIREVADGTSGYQTHYPEQMPEAINLFGDLHLEWGTELQTPILKYSNEDEVKYTLMEMGISTKSLEGMSVFAEAFTQPDPATLRQYILEKLPLCRDYIKLMTTGGQTSS